MITTNAGRLVQISVLGEVMPASLTVARGVVDSPYTPTDGGETKLLSLWGGITYNVRVGDPALGWVANRVEPGASIRHRDDGANRALLTYSCVGNEATVATGDARGAKGVVIGKHGRFAEHLIVDFPPDVLERLAVGDRVQVKAVGLGLEVAGCPEVVAKGIAPRVLDAIAAGVEGDRLAVRVAAEVPPHLVGAGAGLSSEAGSVAIQSQDRDALAAHGLATLRLGDVVALRDYDCTFSNCYRKGALTIGVVSTGDSPQAGYGPAVTVLLTSPQGKIAPRRDAGANLGAMLGLR
ncbi:MAG: DUF4438 domain-containing protein [Armatimonadetes bacterium]|nr:DUF4438 domain-containing protein [Armatimonadota bacterium]